MIHHGQCPNGLKVTIVPMEARSVGVCLIGNAGGLQASPGLAHFLEHTVLCATIKYPDFVSLANTVDTTGAWRNAMTSQEDMRFVFKCLPEHLPRALDFLAEVVVNPLLLESDVSKQKDIITQEINGDRNDLMSSAFKAALNGLYDGKGPGVPVLGTESDVRALSRDDLVAFHRNAFVAGNFRLVICGKVRPEDAMPVIESTLGRMPQGESLALSPSEAWMSDLGVARSVERRESARQAVVAVAWKAPNANGRLARATYLLKILIADGRLSRLWQSLRQENPLTYSTRCMYNRYRSFGYFIVGAGLAEGNIDRALEEVRGIMKDLSERLVSDDDLERAKNLARAYLLFESDSPFEMATYYASKLLYEDSFVSLEDELEQYRLVTKEDVREAAAYIMSQNESVAVITPTK